MNGLSLDMSLSRTSESIMESTMDASYRYEGLMIGMNTLSLYGESIPLEVKAGDLLMGDRIGHGACSSVNVAKHRSTGELFAVKMFNVRDSNQATQLNKEIMLLATVACHALITLKGAFYDQGTVGVIVEYMDKGSLEFIISEKLKLSEPELAAIAFQVIWGLGYLHFDNKLHRDVKPANILMNSLGQVKLSDFGISKDLDDAVAMSNTAIGTYRYMSPERLLGNAYDASGDVWSAGITFLQLWNRKLPFVTISDSPIDLFGEVEKMNDSFDRYLPKATCSASMRQFIKSMLHFEPQKRSTCVQLSSSSWFKECGIETLLDAQMILTRWLRMATGRPSSASPTAVKSGIRPHANQIRLEDSSEMNISIEEKVSLSQFHMADDKSDGSSHQSSGGHKMSHHEVKNHQMVSQYADDHKSSSHRQGGQDSKGGYGSNNHQNRK